MDRSIFEVRDDVSGDGIDFALDGPDRLTVRSIVEDRERTVVVVERGAALRLAAGIIAGLGGTP